MSSTAVKLRSAVAADIPAIRAVYDHYVAHSACTFDIAPPEDAYWRAWLKGHAGPFPAIVAERDGRIVGWGTLSQWNTRCAYRHSAEDSVYVEPACHRQGIGRALLGELIARARKLGHHSVIAQIADHQTASERLHERLGFRRVGCLEAVGFKFDRWIDVAVYQRMLSGEHDE